MGKTLDHQFIRSSEPTKLYSARNCKDHAERQRYNGAEELSRQTVDQFFDTAHRVGAVPGVIVHAVEGDQDCRKGQKQPDTGQ